jgi:hypothetical protein
MLRVNVRVTPNADIADGTLAQIPTRAYFAPALRSKAVGTYELVPRPACFAKHLSPVFTASGPYVSKACRLEAAYPY